MHSVFSGDQIANPADFPVHTTAVNLRSKSTGRARTSPAPKRTAGHILFRADGAIWQLPFAPRPIEAQGEEIDQMLLKAIYGGTYRPLSTLSNEAEGLSLSIGGMTCQ